MFSKRRDGGRETNWEGTRGQHAYTPIYMKDSRASGTTYTIPCMCGITLTVSRDGAFSSACCIPFGDCCRCSLNFHSRCRNFPHFAANRLGTLNYYSGLAFGVFLCGRRVCLALLRSHTTNTTNRPQWTTARDSRENAQSKRVWLPIEEREKLHKIIVCVHVLDLTSN